MSVQSTFQVEIERNLRKEFYMSTSEFEEEAASHGEMFIDDVTLGSVVLQLRPITDQAVQTLLNAKENNKLLQMILGMLKQINISKIFHGSETVQIKLQVCYASQRESNQGKIMYLFSHVVCVASIHSSQAYLICQ